MHIESTGDLIISQFNLFTNYPFCFLLSAYFFLYFAYKMRRKIDPVPSVLFFKEPTSGSIKYKNWSRLKDYLGDELVRLQYECSKLKGQLNCLHFLRSKIIITILLEIALQSRLIFNPAYFVPPFANSTYPPIFFLISDWRSGANIASCRGEQRLDKSCSSTKTRREIHAFSPSFCCKWFEQCWYVEYLLFCCCLNNREICDKTSR